MTTCCARGQATVEAALLIPVFLLALLLALEPAILLFDRIVLESAASMGCRALATAEAGDEDRIQEYVQRRLDAVPDVPLFHEGAWEIRIQAPAGGTQAQVSIAHSVRLLPLVREAMGLAGLTQTTGLFEQRVERVQDVADEWLAESERGTDASLWIERWEEAI